MRFCLKYQHEVIEYDALLDMCGTVSLSSHPVLAGKDAHPEVSNRLWGLSWSLDSIGDG